MYSNIAPTTMTTMAAPTYGAPTYAAPSYGTASYGTATMAAPSYTSAPMTTMAAPMTTVGGGSTTVMAAPTYTSGMTYSGSQSNLVGGSLTTAMAAPAMYATQTLASSGSVTSLSGALSGSLQAPIMSYTQSPNTVTRMASFGNQANNVSRMSSLGAPLTGQQHSAMPYMPMGAGSTDPSTAFTAGASLNFASGAPKPVQMPKRRPQSALEGIPNLQDISKQESAYQAALDKQLIVAIKTIKEEIEIEKQMIRFNTEKNIALFQMAEEEKQTEAFALLDEKLAIQSLELKKALVERNLQLSAQANGLRMDFQQKFLEDELAGKQYEFAVQYYNVEHKLEEDYAAQVALANTGTMYAAPAGVTGPSNFSGGVSSLTPMMRN